MVTSAFPMAGASAHGVKGPAPSGTDRGEHTALLDFNLNLLAPLDALLHERSVTAAARRLGVSQPTMSGMLARLREHLHDPLLVRVGQSMELSPRAAEITSEVRQILLAVQRLALPGDHPDLSTVRHEFRIMASEYSLFLILPQVLRQAEIAMPSASFELVPIDQPAISVYDGSVDLCVTGDLITGLAAEAAAAVRTRKLLDDPLIGVVDSAHPLRGEVTLAQIYEFPHVATQFPRTRTTVENIGLSAANRHAARVRVPSFLAIGPMVSGSTAIGVVPSRLAPLVCTRFGLRTIGLPNAFDSITVRMLWHGRDDRPQAQRWLRGAIIAACSELS